MKINTISDLKKLMAYLERFEDSTTLSISVKGKVESFSVIPLSFSHTLGQKQPDLISLQIFKSNNRGML